MFCMNTCFLSLKSKFFLRCWALFTIVVAIGLSNANAQTMTLIGGGRNSCGTWTSDRQKNEVQAYFLQEWVDGYLSGMEDIVSLSMKKNIQINTDANGIYGWLDNYCRQNPTVNLIGASAAFWFSSGAIKIGD